jgi:hypothetical protein
MQGYKLKNIKRSRNLKLSVTKIQLLILPLLFICCISKQNTKKQSLPKEENTITDNQKLINANSQIKDLKGTIIYVDLEGGFYGIRGEDGKSYNPINLEKEFRQDGIRIEFSASVRKDIMSIQMWGTIVEIQKIRKID